MKKYRKKPIVVEAEQWFLGKEVEGVKYKRKGWVFDPEKKTYQELYHYIVKTLEGDMTVSEGDWIIKGVEGEYYPCKDSIFKKTYENEI